MTRYRVTLIGAVVLALLALAFDRAALAVIVVAAFLLLTGIGVAVPQWSFFGKFICRGDPAQRCVALTFDDGPDATSTPALLDLLRAAGVPAAFFCVGERVAANPELAARIVREGHLLQNHSYTHSHFTNFFTPARLREELLRTQTAVQAATGTSPRYFRPPMGLSNPRVFRVAGELGLQVIGWSTRSLDTLGGPPAGIARRIARRLEPGAIILLHDGRIPAARLVLTVEMVLATLREHGYEVRRLDRML